MPGLFHTYSDSRRTPLIVPFLVLALALGTLLAATQADAQTRRALVVGINTYETIPSLQKAVNDANAVGAQLEAAGFETDVVLDADGNGLISALERLALQVEPGDEVVFYFAGHGVEIDGQNYLLPADIQVGMGTGELALRRQSLPVSEVTTVLQQRGARVSLLILDACRDNPFAATGTRSAVGSSRGLARMTAPEGTYIMFSAGAGQAALDSLGPNDSDPNSVFTRALLPRLATPGVLLRDAVLEVRSEVRELAGSVGHNQFPAVYDQLDGRFAFTPAAMGYGTASQSAVVLDTTPEAPAEDTAIDPECLAARSEWAGLRGLASVGPLQNFTADLPPDCNEVAREAKGRLSELRGLFNASCSSALDGLVRNYRLPYVRYSTFYEDLIETQQACDGVFESTSADPNSAYLAGKFLLSTAMGFEALQMEDPDPQRFASARRLLERSADIGNDDAFVELGWLYENGHGVEQDYAEAMRLYSQAAFAGNARGMSAVGWLHEFGLGMPQDDVEALRWYRLASAAGDPMSTARVGWMYWRGRGIEQDREEAIKWFRQAAAEGENWGEHNLGMAYRTGQGVEQDFAEAVSWFRKSAEQGNASAMNAMAWFYANGNGVAQSDEEALRWYVLSADHGDLRGITQAANYYKDGIGTDRNLKESLRLYRRAAEAGHSGSMVWLAAFFREGTRVEENDAAALNWYMKAAEAGNTRGMANAAWMYSEGEGTRADPVLAARLYTDAVRAGHPTRSFERVFSNLNPDTVREVQAILKDAGAYAGPVDGTFTPETLDAINAYASM